MAHPYHPKPLAPKNTTAVPHGSEAHDVSPSFLCGTTSSANPSTHTVSVDIENGGTREVQVLASYHDSDGRGGAVSLPKAGSRVVLGTGPNNQLFIIGYLKDASSSSTADAATNTASPMATPYIAGSADPVHTFGGTDSYREGDPGDAGVGDWMLRGSEGNGLGVLEGGVSIFKAGELSQILGFKVGDLIRVVAKNLELFTGMGELKFITEDKKARIEFRGSTDSVSAHPSVADWNIEAGIGGDANLFHLRFLNPGSGKIKAGITITKDGDIMLEGRTISEHEHASKTPGKKTRYGVDEKISASDVKTVGDTYARTAKTISRVAESDIKDSAGSGYSLTASDISVKCAHISAEYVAGYRPEKDGVAIPGKVPGKTFTVTNGNFEVDVGKGGLPATYPSIDLKTYAGDIGLTVNLGGSITLNTTTIPSGSGLAGPFGIVLNSPMVLLGGIGSPLTPFTSPGMAACKYEALLVYVTALHEALLRHVHPTVVGPSGPSPDLAASLGALTLLVPPIMSTTTRIYL